MKADTDYTSFLTGTLSLKEENEVNPCLDCVFRLLLNQEDTESLVFFPPPFEILIRFIFFVCHLVDLSWYVRVCSLILMRYGTFLLALLINAFSPLSSPLVIIRLSWVTHLKEFGVLVESEVLYWRMCQKLIMILSFKVNHLELRYGKFLSYMVNWILHSWSVLHLLMHMLVRSIGELMIYHVSSLLLQWCRSIRTFLSDSLLLKLTLSFSLSCANSVLWWPSGRCDKLISMDEQNIFLWSLDCSKKSAEVNQLRGCIEKLVFLGAFASCVFRSFVRYFS